MYFFETASNDSSYCLLLWWHLDQSVQPFRANRGTMCSASSLPLNLIKLFLRPVETRDIVLLQKEGTAANFLPLRSHRLSQPGLGKLFISSLAEAVIVKRNSEPTASSEASPSYEGTSGGMSWGCRREHIILICYTYQHFILFLVRKLQKQTKFHIPDLGQDVWEG